MTARAHGVRLHERRSPPGRRGSLLLLAGSGALVAAAAAVGALSAARAGETYAALERPGWAPPSWLFSPVWTALYVLIAVAGWLVVRQGLGRRAVRVALALFVAQLALNAAWTPIFFGAGAIGWAAVEIVALLVVLAATVAAFWRVSAPAGALLLPYLGWVGFAAALNLAIVAMN